MARDAGRHRRRHATGGRLKRVADYINDEEAFCFTYGDGVEQFEHSLVRSSTTAATASWRPSPRCARPGATARWSVRARLSPRSSRSRRGDGGLINGGFFVLSPRCLDLIEGDDSSWESSPIIRLAAMGQMMAFEHRGFWQPMDTLRDKTLLEELWASGKAPWKIWH